ncbi:MAG: hypothetical protein ABR562_07775 [Thermoplasmatota archaeon]|nr:hypothetical protein [Halobacteriales archaeon]
MRSIRMLAAVAFLAAAAAALGWAWLHAEPPATTTGDFGVTVRDADGHAIFNGTVHATNATALSVLQEAARRAGFEVQVRSFGAYGGRACDGQYVESVAGRGAEGASGWVVRVWRKAAGEWSSPVQSAACEALADGDAVEWRWTAAAAV